MYLNIPMRRSDSVWWFSRGNFSKSSRAWAFMNVRSTLFNSGPSGPSYRTWPSYSLGSVCGEMNLTGSGFLISHCCRRVAHSSIRCHLKSVCMSYLLKNSERSLREKRSVIITYIFLIPEFEVKTHPSEGGGCGSHR